MIPILFIIMQLNHIFQFQICSIFAIQVYEAFGGRKVCFSFVSVH
jgi:hypothetical protein